MTPQLSTCLAPHFSLFQDGDPSPRGDDRFVARALALAAQDGDAQAAPVTAPVTAPVRAPLAAPLAATPTGLLAVQITAAATAPGGRFVRRATARLTPSDDGRPFRILLWDSPPT